MIADEICQSKQITPVPMAGKNQYKPLPPTNAATARFESLVDMDDWETTRQVTIKKLLLLCGKDGRVEDSFVVHSGSRAMGIPPDPVTLTIVISTCARRGKVRVLTYSQNNPASNEACGFRCYLCFVSTFSYGEC